MRIGGAFDQAEAVGNLPHAKADFCRVLMVTTGNITGLTDELEARRHGDGILFKLPQKIDRMNSIPLQPVIKDGVTVLKGSGDRQRASRWL